eukprot:TRINITY_DN7587_c0_g1::TRINITY_DN7587_c0_g1_i1::g.1961::m.1961 TRINITY_DN7587_c0_g1::TRINITY_DN7587_c0_g1_i1::g.1961  ORF type:complete len:434 (-),score=83.10,sp/Q3SZ16/IAH1_BOVIN/42.22/3e-51,Lipase_GDSL/PF00657.17/9.9e-28,Lipase_GDSL_2/PF13472.1/2.7e-21,Ftsk_gamma/PF09397.5/0.12,DUF303/PF03629.13/0.16,Barstar/PF01337.13/0.4 TRINITY_DN7587_c0_g1_i1:348-1649(-)
MDVGDLEKVEMASSPVVVEDDMRERSASQSTEAAPRKNSMSMMQAKMMIGFQKAAVAAKSGGQKIMENSQTLYREKMPVVKEKLGEAATATKHGVITMNEKVIQPSTEVIKTHLGTASDVLKRQINTGLTLLDRKLHAKKYIRRPNIVLFGDSITQFSFASGGWGAKLSEAYVRKADVINRGFSGYNTRHANAVVSMLPRAALYVIFLGANDAALPEYNKQQSVHVDEYGQNLRALVECLRKVHSRHNVQFLFVTPPPVYIHAWSQECLKKDRPLDRNNEQTEKIAQKCKETAQAMGIPCVNLFQEMMSSTSRWQDYLNDGLHLSDRGNQFVFDTVTEAIATHYPALTPDNLEFDLPLWAEIDPNNVEAAFTAYIDRRMEQVRDRRGSLTSGDNGSGSLTGSPAPATISAHDYVDQIHVTKLTSRNSDSLIDV